MNQYFISADVYTRREKFDKKRKERKKSVHAHIAVTYMHTRPREIRNAQKVQKARDTRGKDADVMRGMKRRPE